MTSDENTPTDGDRSDYIVWDYPLEDKFTKMYFTMTDAGFVPSVEHAVKVTRNVNRTYEFALTADAIAIKYLVLTNCYLRKLSGEIVSERNRKSSPLRTKFDDVSLVSIKICHNEFLTMMFSVFFKNERSLRFFVLPIVSQLNFAACCLLPIELLRTGQLTANNK